MNNSLILTVIDLIGKRKTENLIEKGFFNKSTELNEKEILECIERYKEINFIKVWRIRNKMYKYF